MTNKNHYIYALLDPNTNEVRYVGCSVNPFKRYQEHTNIDRICNEVKHEWVEALSQTGQKPALILLDKCGDRATGRERETAWITTLLTDGAPLTNRIYRGCEGINKGMKWRR